MASVSLRRRAANGPSMLYDSGTPGWRWALESAVPPIKLSYPIECIDMSPLIPSSSSGSCFCSASELLVLHHKQHAKSQKSLRVLWRFELHVGISKDFERRIFSRNYCNRTSNMQPRARHDSRRKGIGNMSTCAHIDHIHSPASKSHSLYNGRIASVHLRVKDAVVRVVVLRALRSCSWYRVVGHLCEVERIKRRFHSSGFRYSQSCQIVQSRELTRRPCSHTISAFSIDNMC